MLKTQKKKFTKLIFVGIINTLIGYVSLISLEIFLHSFVNIFFLTLISRIFTIFIAYINLKLIVFKNSWIYFKFEIIKIYLIYFVSTIFFSITITILTEYLKFDIHIALIITILINFIFTSKRHIDFTFNNECNFRIKN